MKIQVNSNQLERIVVRWLNLYYGDLRPKEFDSHPDDIFYVNSSDDIIMYHIKIGKVMFIDELIWEQLETIFNIEHTDAISIINVWLKETYNLEGFYPYRN